MESAPTSSPWSSNMSKELTGPITDKQFESAITVWIKKPHTVNRRLIGAKIIHETELSTSKDCFRVIWDNIRDLRKERTIEELCERLKDVLVVSKVEETTVSVSIRDLVPKQLDRFHTAREMIVKCKTDVQLKLCRFLS